MIPNVFPPLQPMTIDAVPVGAVFLTRESGDVSMPALRTPRSPKSDDATGGFVELAKSFAFVLSAKQYDGAPALVVEAPWRIALHQPALLVPEYELQGQSQGTIGLRGQRIEISALIPRRMELTTVQIAGGENDGATPSRATWCAAPGTWVLEVFEEQSCTWRPLLPGPTQ